MWRYLTGGLAALALVAAGVVLFNRSGQPIAALAAAPPASGQAGADDAALPDTAPAASDKTREQKRFARYDKDRDGAVAREEFLAPRRKAFAKLDANHDGNLSFDEWAVKTGQRFTLADADKSGAMTPTEFAATAPKRRVAHVKKDCAPAQAAAGSGEDS